MVFGEKSNSNNQSNNNNQPTDNSIDAKAFLETIKSNPAEALDVISNATPAIRNRLMSSCRETKIAIIKEAVYALTGPINNADSNKPILREIILLLLNAMEPADNLDHEFTLSMFNGHTNDTFDKLTVYGVDELLIKIFTKLSPEVIAQEMGRILPRTQQSQLPTYGTQLEFLQGIVKYKSDDPAYERGLKMVMLVAEALSLLPDLSGYMRVKVTGLVESVTDIPLQNGILLKLANKLTFIKTDPMPNDKSKIAMKNSFQRDTNNRFSTTWNSSAVRQLPVPAIKLNNGQSFDKKELLDSFFTFIKWDRCYAAQYMGYVTEDEFAKVMKTAYEKNLTPLKDVVSYYFTDRLTPFDPKKMDKFLIRLSKHVGPELEGDSGLAIQKALKEAGATGFHDVLFPASPPAYNPEVIPPIQASAPSAVPSSAESCAVVALQLQMNVLQRKLETLEAQNVVLMQWYNMSMQGTQPALPTGTSRSSSPLIFTSGVLAGTDTNSFNQGTQNNTSNSNNNVNHH